MWHTARVRLRSSGKDSCRLRLTATSARRVVCFPSQYLQMPNKQVALGRRMERRNERCSQDANNQSGRRAWPALEERAGRPPAPHYIRGVVSFTKNVSMLQCAVGAVPAGLWVPIYPGPHTAQHETESIPSPPHARQLVPATHVRCSANCQGQCCSLNEIFLLTFVLPHDRAMGSANEQLMGWHGISTQVSALSAERVCTAQGQTDRSYHSSNDAIRRAGLACKAARA